MSDPAQSEEATTPNGTLLHIVLNSHVAFVTAFKVRSLLLKLPALAYIQFIL